VVGGSKTDRHTDIRTDKHTDRHTDGRTDGRTDKQTDIRQTDFRTDSFLQYIVVRKLQDLIPYLYKLNFICVIKNFHLRINDVISFVESMNCT